MFFGFSSPVFSQQIIAHPDVEHTLSRNTLRSIYSMRLSSWADGKNISVFVMNPSGEEHRQICLEVLNVFPYQLQRVWDVLVFSGTGQSPIVVKTKQEMIEKVSSTPGAIGYISDSEVPANVKVINVE